MRILLVCVSLLIVQAAYPKLTLKKGDRVLLYGNSFIERLQEHGLFEASVQYVNPGKNIEFRSLAWTGDEVGHRLRPERYVNHLKKLLEKWPANVVILGFGQNESFLGASGVARFQHDLVGYLEEVSRRHAGAKIVLVSPIATEYKENANYPDVVRRNAEIKLYAEVMANAAKHYKVEFVDLYTSSLKLYKTKGGPFTHNGIHLNSKGYDQLALTMAKAIFEVPQPKGPVLNRIHEIANAVSSKAGHVANIVRPVNTVLYFGVRGRAKEYAAEMPRYHQLIENSEAAVHEMARHPAVPFDSSPATLEPLVVHPPSQLTSPDDMLKQFQVAEGYEVNLFASEREFPELRNPEQIAFDDQGRLWVVTMPSFPGTIPGDVPADKILILEDTDRDGRADKSTVFADGLTVPDGLAFHQDGVIVSHQPRLVFMKDTDGDGRADFQQELLRGIDVTDAHHGGMIAMGPLGHVMFCDGVFHRSQLETPHGVVRGIDATTYRLDLRSGRIHREYQTLTPNPWKITWDRWGNLFQMYGDGFVQDSHAMPWTPFGVYHPFKRGISIAYGKGSAACVISSPNFPEEYQQGMASAVLLRKCFVSISKHKAEGAYFKGSDRLDILSSPSQLFRPVDIAFGFDGAMYVSDFCSRIIGHAQNAMRDPRWDAQAGRVWRIVHKGRPIAKDWPEIKSANPAQLLKLLNHQQDIVRDHARRRLRNTPDVVRFIDNWLKEKRSDEQILQALWILHDQREVRPLFLEILLGSSRHEIRAAAIHLIRFQAAQLKDPFALLRKMANDPHPRVRTEVIHVVSHLQQDDPAYASILGEIDTSGDKSLETILADASHGVSSGHGPEIPILEKPASSQISHWLLREGDSPERIYKFGTKAGSHGTMRTFVKAPALRRAILSIRHSYVRVLLNGVPVINSANWWSSDWNVQVQLKAGVNEIEVQYPPGRRSGRYAPLYLYSPRGTILDDVQVPISELTLGQLAMAHHKASGRDGNSLRISAVPNQLAFTPTEVTVKSGQKLALTFDNPDIQIHNLVLVKPGSESKVGQLADQMAQDPDATAREYVPASDDVLWATPLVDPGGKTTLEITTPVSPGRYPFLCTFPGHWRVMKGILVVRE